MIELKLKNFRCFENKTFTFNNEMSLVSAPSGSGKSTIISAIQFALWGKISNEIMHGKTSCMVNLTIEDDKKIFKIQRSKRPNRLVVHLLNKEVETSCEDEEGQVLINNYFGKDFNRKNFLESSPSDKLEFLEGMALGDVETVNLLKTRIKDKIGNLNDEIKNVDGQLDLANKMLNSSKDENFDSPPIVPILEYQEQYDDDFIETLESEIKALNSKLVENAISKSKLEILEQQVTKFQKLISETKNRIAVLNSSLSSTCVDHVESKRFCIEQLTIFQNSKTQVLVLKSNIEMLTTEYNLICSQIQNWDDKKNEIGKDDLLKLIENQTKRLREIQEKLFHKSCLESEIETNQNKLKKSQNNVQITTNDLSNLNIANIQDELEKNQHLQFESDASLKIIRDLKNKFENFTGSRFSKCEILQKSGLLSRLIFLNSYVFDYFGIWDLKKLLNEIQKVKMSSEGTRCPKCFHRLTINENEIIESRDDEISLSFVDELLSLMKENNINDINLFCSQLKKQIDDSIEFNTIRQQLENESINFNNFHSKNLGPVIYDLQEKISDCQSKKSVLEKEELKIAEYLKIIDEKTNEIHNFPENQIDVENIEKELVELKRKLKTREMFDVLQEIQSKINEKNTEIDSVFLKLKIQNFDDLNIEITRLEKLLSELAKDLETHTEIKNYSNQLHKETTNLEQVTQEIQTLREILSGNSHGFDDMKLSELNNQAEHVKLVLQKQQQFKHDTIQYNTFMESKKRYDSRIDELTTLLEQREKEKRILNDQYTSALVLKTKISEAQGLALTSLVDTINVAVQSFLDSFFEDPIVINLSMFKSGKTGTKQKVTIDLYYKGTLCDLSSLSSGEYARVSLAFTLAFFQINGNKLLPLMLDERTANLDQDLSTLIYDVVKETFSSCTIIVIAHQVITGPFDKILSLKES